MRLTITGTPKEIAALVLNLKERPRNDSGDLRKLVKSASDLQRKPIRGISPKGIMSDDIKRITAKVNIINKDDLAAKVEKLSELLQQFKELSESMDTAISYEFVKTQDQAES